MLSSLLGALDVAMLRASGGMDVGPALDRDKKHLSLLRGLVAELQQDRPMLALALLLHALHP